MINYQDRLEIDLLDLMVQILKKSKAIIICAFIGAVLFGGYSYWASGVSTATHEYLGTFDEYSIIDAREQLKDADAIWVEEDVIMSLRYEDWARKNLKEASKTEAYENVSNKSSYSYMTTLERAYYKALYAEILKQIHEGEFKNVDDWLVSIGRDDYSYASYIVSDIPDVSDNSKVVHSLSIKYILIGFMAGAFIVILIAALKYILTPVLRTTDDLAVAFELPVLGEIKGDNNMELVVSSVIGASKNMGIKRLALSGSIDDVMSDSIKNEVQKGASANNMDVVNCRSILKLSSAVEEAANSDAIMLVEKVGISKYDDIAKELELCNNLGIKVLGAIVCH
ncbi:hypothetical protein [Butyrivibrio sp. FCS014]|uniref:hypothetical protein n=1 Tax=Butyrivibrio sp. FCS014 TaxID=1408304 RepID=UPI000466CB01|nr:hypothetical protein [Butyrivibrio sp. FCS014]